MAGAGPQWARRSRSDRPVTCGIGLRNGRFGPLWGVRGPRREKKIVTVELVDRRVGTGAGRLKLSATALDLFAQRGVSATSLQMIADAAGVTKAAVYHHFKSKDEIVLAVVRPALDHLAEVAALAESKRSRSAQVDAVIRGLADLVIGNRRLYGLMHGDPTCAAILRERSGYPVLAERLVAVLAGPTPDMGSVMAAGMLLTGLRGAGIDPRVTALDDEQFRRHLVACSQRLIRARRPSAGSGRSPRHPGIAPRHAQASDAARTLDVTPVAAGPTVVSRTPSASLTAAATVPATVPGAVPGFGAAGEDAAAGAVPLDERDG